MKNLFRSALVAWALACVPTLSASAQTDPVPTPLICHECDYEEPREPPPPPVPAPVDDAAFVAQQLPPTIAPNATATARVQMRNTGNTVWTSDALYRLGAQNPGDNTVWGTGRVALAGNVAPGETATFEFSVRAPGNTGLHNFQWRMVRDGVAWFGAWTPNATIHVASDSPVHPPPPPPPTPATVTLTRRYTYNAHQELCRTDEPESGTTFFDYDGARNLLWSAAGFSAVGAGCATAADVAARRVDRTYDARNRVQTLRFPDGRGDANYGYALDGLPTAINVNNGDGELLSSTYVYNRRRLLVQETLSRGPGGWPVYYGYDANGHLASQHWYGVTVDYAPNALGQPTRAGEFATNVRRHANGAIAHFTYGNGVLHTTVQNARQLPDTRVDAYAGIALFNEGYDYDATGNVAAITDGAAFTHQRGNRTMGYDGLDRLVAVSSPMFGNARYEYDALDNLTRTTIGGPAARDHWHCHDAHNRLTNIKANGCGGTSVVGMGYDAQGNLANRNGVAYHFDDGNRLRNVVAPHGTSTYTYDGHGRRFLDATPAGDKYSQYAHDGRLVLTSDARTNRISQYVHLGGALIAIREIDAATGAVATKYQHTDALGTPVAVTDQHRNVIERSEYEPYGKVINRTQKDGPGFTGHVEDAATGLTYMQQRYYDSGVGRFPTVDPVTAYGGGDWRQFNRYAYADNNPYRFIDPDGRDGLMFYARPEFRMPAPPPEAAGPVIDLLPFAGDIKGFYEASQNPTAINVVSAVVGLAGPLGDGAAKFLKRVDNVAAPNAYSVAYETTIPKTGVGSREAHKAVANRNLAASAVDPDAAQTFFSLGIKPVQGSSTPVGYQWHHVFDRPGVMQLVPDTQHTPGSTFQGLLHPQGRGGYSQWGRDW